MDLVVITRQFGIVGRDSQLAGRTEKVQGGIPDRNNLRPLKGCNSLRSECVQLTCPIL